MTSTPGPAGGSIGGQAGGARRDWLSALAGSALFSARFLTIWIALGLLLVVALIISPDTLSSDSRSILLPLGSIVAIAAVGQMLVVMTGGIDLSVAGTISLMANVMVGAADGANDQILSSVLLIVALTIVIGLVNGTLVAVVGLNPLIVTLAVGFVLLGITTNYRLGTANEAAVPEALSNWVFTAPLGISWVFWTALALTVLLALFIRSTPPGRRFQAVGANPRAAWIAGIRVRMNVIMAYVGCSVMAGIAAILLAGVINNPESDPGAPYLFGPIAAVLLGGTALSGGLASVTSVWAAAFFLETLNQMLRVLGLSSALQYIVYGGAIVLGMVISGDRIAALVGRVMQRPWGRRLLGGGEEPT